MSSVEPTGTDTRRSALGNHRRVDGAVLWRHAHVRERGPGLEQGPASGVHVTVTGGVGGWAGDPVVVVVLGTGELHFEGAECELLGADHAAVVWSVCTSEYPIVVRRSRLFAIALP